MSGAVLERIDDDLWSAIGDPTRRRILDLLLVDGDGTATSLSEQLPVTRQAVAKHLGVLDRVALVWATPAGREKRYRVDDAQLARAAAQLAAVGSAWDARLHRIKQIAEAIQRNIDKVGMPQWSEEEQRFARDFQKSAGRQEVGLWTEVTPLGGRPQSYASNDSGDISWTVPAGVLAFPASVPGIQYHEWHAAITPTSTIAHKGMVAGAKVMAGALLDLLTEPDLLRNARAEFAAATRATPYFEVLPADAKPPLDLNKANMDRYRPDMRKFYLNESPRLN